MTSIIDANSTGFIETIRSGRALAEQSGVDADTVIIGGQEYRRSIDPETGDLLLTNEARVTLPDGTVSTAEIVLRFRADGTASRQVTQDVRAPDGAHSNVVEVTEFSSTSQITGSTRSVEITDASGAVTTEDTVTTYAAGQPVRKELDQTRFQELAGEGGATTTSTQRLIIHTGDGTAPITNTTPGDIDFTDVTEFTTPDEGYTKGSPRIITQTRTASGRTDTGIRFDPELRIEVNFIVKPLQIGGRELTNGSAITRVLTLPVDPATGAIDNDAAPTDLGTTDGRPLPERGLEQARIWGGFAGSWLGILGVNWRNPKWARRLGVAGVGLAGAQMAGNGYALIADYRNGSPFDLARATYETAIAGGIYLLIRSRTGGRAAAKGVLSPMRLRGLERAAAIAVPGTAVASSLTGSVLPSFGRPDSPNGQVPDRPGQRFPDAQELMGVAPTPAAHPVLVPRSALPDLGLDIPEMADAAAALTG